MGGRTPQELHSARLCGCERSEQRIERRGHEEPEERDHVICMVFCRKMHFFCIFLQ